MNLKGKTAVVTGSTSGIGLGIATALAEAGANILLNGFGEFEPIKAKLAADHNVRVAYSPADISKPDQIASMIETAIDELGGLDILVNNAGIQHVAPIEAFPIEQWDRVIAINLSGAFHAMHVAIPHLRQAGWGRIINIASAHGLVGSPQKAAYVAAKHGIIGLTKVAALELANSGTTCNAICPGWVLTPLVQAQLDARAKAENVSVAEMGQAFLREKQALLEFSTPEQIGAMALYLCSDAAKTITGASMVIDGGWTAQ